MASDLRARVAAALRVDGRRADDRLVGDVTVIVLRELAGLARVARVRVACGHNDTCGAALGEYSCTCGHDALGETLERMGDLAQTGGNDGE